MKVEKAHGAHRAIDEVKLPHGGHGEHGTRCMNCDAVLAGPYCHACGQTAHVHKSLLHLGEEVAHGILHFDTKGWRTLPMLVAHPGQLTRRYIDGHRTRYVSPLALFLFMVFLMFFVASLTSGKSNLNIGKSPIAVATARTEISNDMRDARKALVKAEAALAQAKVAGVGVSEAEGEVANQRTQLAALEKALKMFNITGELPLGAEAFKSSSLKVDTGWAAADEAIRHAVANPELTMYKLKSTGSKLSFLLVPISLPFLWLLFFWRRGVTMYDHAVFSLYSLSFMSLLFVVFFLLNYVGASLLSQWLVGLAPPIHMFLQLRGTYGLRNFQALWRTVALLCTASTVFTVYLVLILIMSVT